MLATMCLGPATYAVATAPADWSPFALLALTLVLAAGGGAALLPRKMAPRHLRKSLLAAMALTMGIVIAEVAIGAPLHPKMLYGYSLGFGGRFYGIGNEPAGLLIAAALLMVGALSSSVRPSRPPAMAACMLVTLLALAAPNLGANAGCTVGAVICFGLYFAFSSPTRRGGLWVLGFVLLALGVISLAACVDASRGADHATHIGRAWLRLTAEGPAYVTELVRRKATTVANTMLLVPWMFALVGWVLAWAYALLKPARLVQRAYDRLPEVKAPLQAIAAGGIVMAFINDSGVLIPTIMLAFALPALGLAALAAEAAGGGAQDACQTPPS
jgi:hypothetical protein